MSFGITQKDRGALIELAQTISTVQDDEINDVRKSTNFITWSACSSELTTGVRARWKERMDVAEECLNMYRNLRKGVMPIDPPTKEQLLISLAYRNSYVLRGHVDQNLRHRAYNIINELNKDQ